MSNKKKNKANQRPDYPKSLQPYLRYKITLNF